MRKQQCREGLLMQRGTRGMTWHAKGCPVSRIRYGQVPKSLCLVQGRAR